MSGVPMALVCRAPFVCGHLCPTLNSVFENDPDGTISMDSPTCLLSLTSLIISLEPAAHTS